MIRTNVATAITNFRLRLDKDIDQINGRYYAEPRNSFHVTLRQDLHIEGKTEKTKCRVVNNEAEEETQN